MPATPVGMRSPIGLARGEAPEDDAVAPKQCAGHVLYRILFAGSFPDRALAAHTAGLAPGHVQGNLCILPRESCPKKVTRVAALPGGGIG